MNSKKLLTIALAGMAAAGANDVQASTTSGKIKCEGVAMKYVNDCAANGHACGGKAKKNFAKGEWLEMSASDCEAVKNALKNPAIKKYLEKVQSGTAAAVKRGKSI